MRLTSETGRLAIILSDIEMSAGDRYDDFPHADYLYDFITRYNCEEYADVEIDLVFNGDTFDFLKTEVDGGYPHIIDEELALKKLDKVIAAHGKFFDAIKEFLFFRSRPRRAHFIVGNHDMEVFFPKVQNRIVSLCGGSGQVFFPGLEMRIGDLHIEHGSQHDSLFSLDPSKLFVSHEGRNILNLPWASVALLNVIMPFHKDFFELDRIQPRMAIFDHIPELREWLTGRLWDYWTKDYLRDYLRPRDPLKKISWKMVKEAFRRSFVFNPDVEMGEFFHKSIQRSPEVRTYAVGHVHDPHIWSFGNRKVIQSGCFRDEFMLSGDGKSYTPLPKSYIEVTFHGNQVATSNLLEILGPEMSVERFPKRLEEYVSLITEKLGPTEKRLKDKLDIEAQEEKEEREVEVDES